MISLESSYRLFAPSRERMLCLRRLAGGSVAD
jgi:hypothetical protein